MNSPKFPGESEFERIARELCFLQFSPPVSSQENHSRGCLEKMPFFLAKKLCEKNVCEGRITMGSQNLRGLGAITMFSPPKNVQKQDICSKANRE